MLLRRGSHQKNRFKSRAIRGMLKARSWARPKKRITIQELFENPNKDSNFNGHPPHGERACAVNGVEVYTSGGVVTPRTGSVPVPFIMAVVPAVASCHPPHGERACAVVRERELSNALSVTPRTGSVPVP